MIDKTNPEAKEILGFLEKNDFVMVCNSPASDELCLWECPGGHTWDIDDITDLMHEERQEKARKNCDWSD